MQPTLLHSWTLLNSSEPAAFLLGLNLFCQHVFFTLETLSVEFRSRSEDSQLVGKDCLTVWLRLCVCCRCCVPVDDCFVLFPSFYKHLFLEFTLKTDKQDIVFTTTT